jgi:predicted esterase
MEALVHSTWFACIPFVVALVAGCSLFESGDDGTPVQPDGGRGDHCERAADCADPLVCVAGTCALEGSVNVNGRCSANRDCVTGLYCTALGTCAPAGGGDEGAACADGSDCLRGLTCALDGLAGTCAGAGQADVGEACSGAADCLAGLVCSSAGGCARAADVYPPFAGVTCPPDEAPFRAYFEVPRPGRTLADYYRLPFPNDLRVEPTGELDLAGFAHPGDTVLGVDIVTLSVNALASGFQGFSSVAPVTFRFSSPLDFDSIADGTALFVTDVTDPAAAEFGQNRSRAFDYTSGKGKYVCQNALTLSGQMREPLEPGHTYAAWVSSAVRSAGGGAPTQDADLAAVLAPDPPADAALMAAWQKHASFRTFLSRTGRTPADVAAVAVYTVGDPRTLLRQIVTQLQAAPAPALSSLTRCDGAATSPCAGEGGRVCGDSSGPFWEIHGKVAIPRYQRGTPPFATPADGGGIQFDDMFDLPVVQGTEQVCFALTVPKAAAPAGGWPLVVHAHGTGGSFKDAIDTGIARELATAPRPMATFTFEGVAHGARRGTSTRTPASLMFNVYNPVAARANHVQGAVDVMQALRVAQVATFSVGAAGPVDLDPTRVYFFGHSQGANVGIAALAVSDFGSAAVLSGAGSVLVEGLLRKTSPVPAKKALETVVGEELGGGHPVMVLWQTLYDGVDPIVFAPMLVRRSPPGVASKHVLQTWGKGDTFSPETTLTSTGAAAGMVAADPVQPGNALPVDARPITPARQGADGVQRIAAQFQYATDGTFDGHFVATRVPAAIADWKAFLVSLAAGAPSVP